MVEELVLEMVLAEVVEYQHFLTREQASLYRAISLLFYFHMVSFHMVLDPCHRVKHHIPLFLKAFILLQNHAFT